jgi:hypothetical protein
VRRAALASAAVLAAVLAGGVGAAGEAGGASIAEAPELVLGEVEYGAPASGARFWRIPLLQRDSLTLDLGNGGLSGQDRPIRYCLLAPTVRDATLARSECAWQTTVRRGERYRLRFSAPSSGSWTLGAVSNTCSTFQACATVGWADTFPFVHEFTASVRHFTKIALRGPQVARPGAKLTFAGTVTGADGGKVQIQTAPSGARATVAIKRNGTFTWSTRAASRPGTYRVRAVYAGDAGHLPSNTVVSFLVTG